MRLRRSPGALRRGSCNLRACLAQPRPCRRGPALERSHGGCHQGIFGDDRYGGHTQLELELAYRGHRGTRGVRRGQRHRSLLARAYHYQGDHDGSAEAAAAQAAHDVLLNQLPNPAVDAGADRAGPRARLAGQRAGRSLWHAWVCREPTKASQRARGRAAARSLHADTTTRRSSPPTEPPSIPSPTPASASGARATPPGVVNPVTGAPTGFDAAGRDPGTAGHRSQLARRDAVQPHARRRKCESGRRRPAAARGRQPRVRREVAYVRAAAATAQRTHRRSDRAGPLLQAGRGDLRARGSAHRFRRRAA